MEETVFSVLYRKIRESKESLTDCAMSGGARDYIEYCKIVAKHQVLDSFEEDIKDLEKRFMDQ
jgi:hypothetical protein